MKETITLILTAVIIITGVIFLQTDLLTAKSDKRVTIEKGENRKLPLKNRKSYIYKSSNKKVAQVSKKGIVKAKKIGKATIKAMHKSNRKIQSFRIIVKKSTDKSVLASTQTKEPIEQLTDQDALASTPTKEPTESLNGYILELVRGKLLSIEPVENGKWKSMIEISALVLNNIENKESIKYACVTVDNITGAFEKYKTGEEVLCLYNTRKFSGYTVEGDTIYLNAMSITS